MKLRPEDIEIAVRAIDSITSLDEVNELRKLVIAHRVTFDEIWAGREYLIREGYPGLEIPLFLRIAATLCDQGYSFRGGLNWAIENVDKYKLPSNMRVVRFKGKTNVKAKDKSDLQQRLRTLRQLLENVTQDTRL